jgi:hypothetical protein
LEAAETTSLPYGPPDLAASASVLSFKVYVPGTMGETNEGVCANTPKGAIKSKNLTAFIFFLKITNLSQLRKPIIY